MKYLRLAMVTAVLSLGVPLVYSGETPPDPCLKKAACGSQIEQPQFSTLSSAIAVALRMLLP